MGIAVWCLGLQELSSGPGEIRLEPWYLLAMAGAVATGVLRHRILRRVARGSGRLALAATAAHFPTDAPASVCVPAGLVLAALGWPVADTLATLLVAALLVAALLFLSAWRVGQPAADILLKRSDPRQSQDLLADLSALPGDVEVRRPAIHPGPQGHAVVIVVAVRLADRADIPRLAAAVRATARARLGRGTATVEVMPVGAGR